MRVRLLPLAAVAAASTLVLTACSPGGGGDLSYEDSPLAKYFSAGYDPNMSEEEMQLEMAAQQMRAEELMAQCMADEGFEYIPVDWSASGGMVSSTDLDVEWDSREFAERYGYGVFTSPWDEFVYDPEGEEFVDPNQAYVESLSDSERDAYYEAAYGKMQEESEDGYVEYDWETAGCQGRAQHEVYGGSSWDADEFSDLLDSLNRLYTDLERDPRVLDLDREWASCMADAGYSGLTSPRLAQDEIWNQMNRFWEDQNADYPDGDGPDIRESAEYREAAAAEISQAVADWDCKDGVGYTQEMLKIQFALEEQFVNDHRSELEAFQASQEQASR